MSVPVVHPRFLDQLKPYFPSTVLVQQKTVSQDTAGEEMATWTTVEGLDEVPAAIAPETSRGDGENRRAMLTEVHNARRLLLRGVYAQIKPAMRLVDVDGVAWNILAVEIDSQSSLTRIGIERVNP